MNPTITKLTQTLDNLHTPKPGETLYQHLKTHHLHHIPHETLNQIIQHHTTRTTHALAA